MSDCLWVLKLWMRANESFPFSTSKLGTAPAKKSCRSCTGRNIERWHGGSWEGQTVPSSRVFGKGPINHQETQPALSMCRRAVAYGCSEDPFLALQCEKRQRALRMCLCLCVFPAFFPICFFSSLDSCFSFPLFFSMFLGVFFRVFLAFFLDCLRCRSILAVCSCHIFALSRALIGFLP